jgi:hypothetical protein
MVFLLYAIGLVVLVTGLAWLATMAGIAQTYILAGAVVMLCVGAVSAFSTAAARDTA